MAYDKHLCSEVVTVLVRALYRHLRAKAKRDLGLGSVHDAHPGSITFLQRAGSAVNLHPHLHVPVLDGVYVVDQADGGPPFHVLSAPTPEQLVEIVDCAAHRLETTHELIAPPHHSPGSTPGRLAHCRIMPCENTIDRRTTRIQSRPAACSARIRGVSSVDPSSTMTQSVSRSLCPKTVAMERFG